MRFGLVTHVVGDGDSTKILRDTIQLAQIAEDSGFSSFWVAQHHFGSHRGHLPSPLVLLAAIAQETNTIQIGTAVITGALENPIRLAEDAATLDAICGGRLQLGLGAGADPSASSTFGIDHADRHRILRDHLHQLREELNGNRVRPKVPGLQNRLWLATGSNSGYDLASDLGMGVLAGRRASPNAAEDKATSQRLASFCGNEKERGRTPRTGLSRSIFCAANCAEARWRLAPSITKWLNEHSHTGRFPNGYSVDDYLTDRHILIGDPLRVLEELDADPCREFTSDLLANVPQQHPDFDDNATSIQKLGAMLMQHRSIS